MAQPNGLNPIFLGKVKGAGFDALHGKGVSTTAIELNSATQTAKNVFGTTNGFDGSVSGMLISCINANSGSVTLKGPWGTYATVEKLDGVAGSVRAATTFSYTAITTDGTLQVVGSMENSSVRVYLTYKVYDNT